MPPTDPAGQAIARISERGDLSAEQAEAAFAQIMRGEATPVQIAALLAALRAKGETPAEVAGAVRALRGAMHAVTTTDPRTVDTCGTGGGSATTFNISTAAAFVVAGAGVPVAKHGNRSFTSQSGSADVLEALGLAMPSGPGPAADQLRRCGMTFLFAPHFHPAMKHVGPIRRELGITTIMNILGPLANPAGVKRQVVGVADAQRAELIAGALAELDTERAMVVHGRMGLDELAPSGPTDVWHVERGQITKQVLEPESLGLPGGTAEDLRGGTPAENAAIILAVLEGRDGGVRRTAVVLNAAAALIVAGECGDWNEATARAGRSIDSGKARNVVDALVSTS